MKYKLYNHHKRNNISITCRSAAEAEAMAYAAAELGHDALYRLFGPNGFVCAWSVIKGRVTFHDAVTIPEEHW